MPREALPGKKPEDIDGYEHDLSRRVREKLLIQMTLAPEKGKTILTSLSGTNVINVKLLCVA